MLKWLARAATAKKLYDWYRRYQADKKARREEARRNLRA